MTKTDEIPPHRRVVLTEHDGRLEARWPIRRLRVLFEDGRTVDVDTDRDDSDLRSAVVKWSGAAIVGVADITDSDPKLL